MAKDKFAEITNAVYKILEFFPEEELLKNKAKEKALAIMENLVLAFLPDNPHPDNIQKTRAASQALKDIEVLKDYLVLARERGWVDSMNLMILLKEYDKIEEEVKPISGLTQEDAVLGKKGEIIGDNNVDKPEEKVSIKTLSKRQEKILEILRTQEKAQVADFKNLMPEVSKRTLRRDLDELLKMGKVERAGEWNQVIYRIGQFKMS